MSTLDYATPKSSAKCEYRIESIGGFLRSFDIEQRAARLLNHHAADGWELVSTQRTFFSRYTFILRRRQ